QGDRFIIAHASGMESLAAYTSAFMITMVPGLIAARVGHALMLPLFASAVHTHARLDRPFTYMAEITTLCAALYLIVFIVAGEAIVPLVFGAHYGGLGAVTAWLAVMWAMRMVQAVAGMALMASGETKPFLFAGLWRASVLPAVAMAAYAGSSMATIAAIGAAGELVSLLYCVARLEKLERGLGGVLLSRAAFLLPVMLAGLLAAGLATVPLPSAPSGSAALVAQMGIMTALSIVVGAVGLAVMPSLRGRVRHLLAERGARLAH
ncbi:MAG: oligosaccharide flippase family protein, partial [Hyphomicrobium sp.]